MKEKQRLIAVVIASLHILGEAGEIDTLIGGVDVTGQEFELYSPPVDPSNGSGLNIRCPPSVGLSGQV